MNIAQDSLKLTTARTAGILTSFVGLSIFSRIFGGDLASFFLIQALLGVASVPVDLGIRGAIEKRVSGRNIANGLISTAVALKIGFLATAALMSFPFRERIEVYLGGDLWLALIVGLVLQELALLILAMLRGELRVGETAVFAYLRSSSWVVFGLVFHVAGFQKTAPIFGLLAGFCLIIVFGGYRLRPSFSRPTIGAARSLLSYGKYDFINNVGWQVFSWTDILLIGVFLSSVHVTAYEVSWRITAVALVLTRAMATTLFPHVSSLAENAEKEQIEQTVEQALVPATVVVIPSVFGLHTLGAEILKTIFNPEFTLASTALVIISLQRVSQSYQMIIGKTLMGIGQARITALITAGSFVLNIVLNIVLIPDFGLIGAAVATTVGYSLSIILQYLILRRFITPNLPIRVIGWSLISSSSMWLVLEISSQRINATTIPEVIVLIAVGATGYMGVMSLSATVRRECSQWFRQLAG